QLRARRLRAPDAAGVAAPDRPAGIARSVERADGGGRASADRLPPPPPAAGARPIQQPARRRRGPRPCPLAACRSLDATRPRAQPDPPFRGGVAGAITLPGPGPPPDPASQPL